MPMKSCVFIRTILIYSILGLLVFVVGVGLSIWNRKHHEQVKKNELLQQVLPLAKAVDIQILHQFSGATAAKESKRYT